MECFAGSRSPQSKRAPPHGLAGPLSFDGGSQVSGATMVGPVSVMIAITMVTASSRPSERGSSVEYNSARDAGARMVGPSVAGRRRKRPTDHPRRSGRTPLNAAGRAEPHQRGTARPGPRPPRRGLRFTPTPTTDSQSRRTDERVGPDDPTPPAQRPRDSDHRPEAGPCGPWSRRNCCRSPPVSSSKRD